MGAPRQPRHQIVNGYLSGQTIFAVIRPSWDDPTELVTLRQFSDRPEADRWVEEIEARQHELVRAVDGFDARTVPFRGVE